MARSIEFLIADGMIRIGAPMLAALADYAEGVGHTVVRSARYKGVCDELWLYGIGDPTRTINRRQHLDAGGRVIIWDVGYYGRKKAMGILRCSINHDHPQAYFDQTPTKPQRWAESGISLIDVHNPKGHIILVGMGPKTHVLLGHGAANWEADKLKDLKKRFPGRKIIYRPKPNRTYPVLTCATDNTSKIEDLLVGAALVVCRHSNVAVDAAIAGVPFECEDGAAMWLQKRPFTVENRLEFLQKLAWWQWNKEEAGLGFDFIRYIIGAQDGP